MDAFPGLRFAWGLSDRHEPDQMKFATLNAFLAMGTTPSHGKGGECTEKVMKFTRYKEMVSPSLNTFNIRTIHDNILPENYSSSLRTDYQFVPPHQIIELTIFFAPYPLRHFTSDKRNLVTDYDVASEHADRKIFVPQLQSQNHAY